VGGPYSGVRLLPIAALGLCLSVLSPAFAQEEPAPGPVLQPVDGAPAACDPGQPGFRYLEVRGSGFEAWSSQHLVGTLVDGRGAAQAHWPNIWVTPRGQLTLELNLCAAPLQNRAALSPGDYTLNVGPDDGSSIAATGITLRDPLADADEAPVPTGPEPTRTPEPRSGPGSVQQPLPPGTAGNLSDSWQLGVTRVSPDAYSIIKAAIPSAVPPGVDLREVMIGLQATYTGAGTGTFTASRLNLLNPRTQARYDLVASNCGAVPGAISPNVVTPGTVVLGNVCFTVPAVDVDSMLLVDNQPSEPARVYFALQ
jgi:hypothetical protein